MAEITGNKTILKIEKEDKYFIWEPFSIKDEGRYNETNNLYQNKWGNKIIFEEINHDLQLHFTYRWSNSNNYGFETNVINRTFKYKKYNLVIRWVTKYFTLWVPLDVKAAPSNFIVLTSIHS